MTNDEHVFLSALRGLFDNTIFTSGKRVTRRVDDVVLLFVRRPVERVVDGAHYLQYALKIETGLEGVQTKGLVIGALWGDDTQPSCEAETDEDGSLQLIVPVGFDFSLQVSSWGDYDCSEAAERRRAEEAVQALIDLGKQAEERERGDA